MIEYHAITSVKSRTLLPDRARHRFSRKRQPSVETDPELSAAFDDPREAADDFDDDAFARAIAEGRTRDPEAYGDQKIA